MKVEVTANRSYAPPMNDRSIDYTRSFINRTGVNIRILDAAGRTRTIRSDPCYHYTTPVLEIHEWFSNKDAVSLDSSLLSLDSNRAFAETGIKLIHTVKFTDLVAAPNGIFLEELNIFIVLDDNMTEGPLTAHPRFAHDIKEEIRQFGGVSIAIELLDPANRLNTMWACLGGEPYQLVPKRTPTPHRECIRIHMRDNRTHIYISKEFEIAELLDKPGYKGIRFYTSLTDARGDVNDPTVAKVRKDREALEADKAAAYKRAFKEGREEALLEAEKAKRAADEKMRKAEEKERASHEAKHGLWTSILTNILKAVTALFIFAKAVQATQKKA